MSKRTERFITGGFVAVCLTGICFFAGWRMNVNDKIAIAVKEVETESETELVVESSQELILPVVTIEIPSVLETEAETEAEPETDAETSDISHENASISHETISDDNFITETMTEPFQTISMILTPEEEQLLMRVASCEAGNQGWIGMALVMRVVLNRREAWGMSISDVIYAKGQFSVIGCDKWNSGFIATEAPIALQAVKDGWDGSQGALFFCAPSGRSQWMATTKQYLFTAWGHEFYR